jgi:hypothetical protein
MNAPVINYIKPGRVAGKVGDTFNIEAVDDFRVESVEVAIYDQQGKLLEAGAAVPNRKRLIWKYRATVANPKLDGTMIRVTAKDMPGNTGEMAGKITVGKSGKKKII